METRTIFFHFTYGDFQNFYTFNKEFNLFFKINDKLEF